MKEIERLSGIKAYTIRTWEKRYAFLKPTRTLTNIRTYNTREVKKILGIALLNKHGTRISELAKMPEKVMLEKIALLNVPTAMEDRTIFELIIKTIDADAAGFENILRDCIERTTIDHTILHTIVPFVERVEILWLTGNITPVQNYFIGNMIRQKIYAALEPLSFVKGKDQKSVCLFLPDKVHQDLGLLCAAYLLKKKGLHVIYLGTNILLNDVDFILKSLSPDFMFMHITPAVNIKFEKFLSQINLRFSIPLIISGQLGLVSQKKIPANVNFKKNMNEVLAFAESL